jgi:hypothetical protein
MEIAMTVPAIKFRGKVHVGETWHHEAITKAFAGVPKSAVHRAYDRVQDGYEDIIFGRADYDGKNFVPDKDFQEARKQMYGFA